MHSDTDPGDRGNLLGGGATDHSDDVYSDCSPRLQRSSGAGPLALGGGSRSCGGARSLDNSLSDREASNAISCRGPLTTPPPGETVSLSNAEGRPARSRPYRLWWCRAGVQFSGQPLLFSSSNWS